MARSHPNVVQRAIAAQRRALTAEERRRCKALNSTVLINRLPTDVLSGIFETYIRVFEANCFPSGIPNLDRCSRDVKVPWSKILRVCTHWYDLITGTPTYWRTIYVGLSVKWLDLCLSRSASAFIDVYFVDSARVPAILLEHLLPHHRRIRILEFDLFPYERLPQVADLLSRDMPTLTSLYLGQLACTNPRLTTVVLWHLRVPQEVFALYHLRELVLNACSVLDMSFSELIHAIGQCQALERLALRSVFGRLVDAPAVSLSRVRSRAPIALYHLHSIHISNNTTTMTSAFLSSFILPAANTVDIEGEYDGVGPSNGLAPILPPSITFPVLSTLTSASLAPCNPQEVSLRGAVSIDPSFPRAMPIIISVSARNPELRFVQGRLTDLTTLLQGAPLESLTIDAFDVVVDTRDSQAWFDVFEAFPQLEKLDVLYMSSMEIFKALWSGLRRASSGGIDDHIIGHTTGNHGPPRSCLRHITFSPWSLGVQLDPPESSFNPVADEIVLYPRERAMAGTRLEILKWDRADCSSLHPQFLGVMRALMERIELEGLVGEVVVTKLYG